MCLDPRLVVHTICQRSEGKWGLGHIPNNSCQPLELEGDVEFININFSFYRRRSGSLAQSGGTKALPKVRFVSLLRVTPDTWKTHKATKLSKGCPPSRYTLVRLCPSALDAVPGLLLGGCLALGLCSSLRNVLWASVEGFGLNVRKDLLIDDNSRPWRGY